MFIDLARRGLLIAYEYFVLLPFLRGGFCYPLFLFLEVQFVDYVVQYAAHLLHEKGEQLFEARTGDREVAVTFAREL